MKGLNMKSIKKSESAKKRWSDPEARKAKSEAMKASWAKRKEQKASTTEAK